MMFVLPRTLKKARVLGINKRNIDLISEYNPRRNYPRVDDKLKTKMLAEKNDIAVPSLYISVEYHFQIPDTRDRISDYPGFVIKPSKGWGGNGILVIEDIRDGLFIRPDGKELKWQNISEHLENILSGLYSLGGQPDKALFEEFVKFDPLFENICYKGVPDIRVIVFKSVPIMAMMRLPTKLSGGRANLHKGAVGVGIDIVTGRSGKGIYRGRPAEEHPDTGKGFSGLEIPRWKHLLQMASSCCDISGLGYIGVDFVFDRDKGPLVLELNARPGLGIQIANRKGLMDRIEKIERYGILPEKNIDKRKITEKLFSEATVKHGIPDLNL
jgi:alpha-L-glutamate ligase-like protein